MAFIALLPSIYINAQQYGATGNGTTDDTAAIQQAINVAANTNGSAVFFPNGTYIITSLTYPGNISLLGSGDADGGTIFRVKAGTALTGPVIASASWNNNATTCGGPVRIADIQIDGNGATSGTGAHGLVAMNYWSSFERISIYSVAGDGFQFTAHAKNGIHITNSCVEPKINRLQVRNVGGAGIHINDDGTTLNSCTDGFLQDCIVQNPSGVGVYVQMGAGWIVSGNHIYGAGNDALDVNKCYATRVVNNYIEGFGTISDSNPWGIGMTLLNGRGSVCTGNTVNFESSIATGPYNGIVINGSGAGTTVCHVSHNLVVGGNQSGSIGYKITANPSQYGFPYIVYFGQNDAQGVATTKTIDSHVTGSDLLALNHINSFAINPITATAGAAAGTTPPVPVKTNCTDVSGNIQWGSGSGTPTTGVQVNVTFAQQYPNVPLVTLTSTNSATAALVLYVTTTATGFSINCNNAPAASQTNTHYGCNYHVLN